MNSFTLGVLMVTFAASVGLSARRKLGLPMIPVAVIGLVVALKSLPL